MRITHRTTPPPNKPFRILLPNPLRPILGGVGGCDVLEDPRHNGSQAFVFWRADAFARWVRLAPAPRDAATLVKFEPRRWGGQQSGLTTTDGYHLIVRPPRGIEHHLFFADPDPPAVGTALVPSPPFDAWHPERLEAALAFWRFAHRPRRSPAPRVPLLRPGPKSLEIAFLIWTLDLNLEGASDREIAEVLFGRAPRNWEDSGFRSLVRRFIAKSRLYGAERWRSLLKPDRSRVFPET